MANRKPKTRKATKNAKGLGSVYTDPDTSRKARAVAERTIRLPDGTRKRLRARAELQEDAIRLLNEKIAKAMDATPLGAILTVDQLLARWLAHKKPTVRTSTYEAYRADVEQYTAPIIGPLPAQRLEPSDVQAVLDPLLAKGHVRTAHRVWRTLKQAFRWSVRMRLVKVSPVDAVDPIRRPERRVRAWTTTETVRFLHAASGTKYHALYYTALSTGLRKGELLALEWRDVREGMIHVERTVSRGAAGGVAVGAKTPEGQRAVPIAPDLADILIAQRARAGRSRLVFPGRGGALLSGSAVSKELRRLEDAAGVPRITFHELRKTSASLLMRSGASAKQVQRRLGHATPNLAMQVYLTVSAEDDARMVLDLAGLGASPTGGKSGGVATKRGYTLLGVWHRDPKVGYRAGHVLARRLRKRFGGR